LARLAGRGLIFRYVDIDLLQRILQRDSRETPRMAGAGAPDDGTIPAEQNFVVASSVSTTIASSEVKMQMLGERVARVEGRVEEQSDMMTRMERTLLRLDERVETRFDGLESRMSRQFTWLVGFHITTLAAIIVAIAAAVAGR